MDETKVTIDNTDDKTISPKWVAIILFFISPVITFSILLALQIKVQSGTIEQSYTMINVGFWLSVVGLVFSAITRKTLHKNSSRSLRIFNLVTIILCFCAFFFLSEYYFFA